jgi:6-phosphofructokinase
VHSQIAVTAALVETATQEEAATLGETAEAAMQEAVAALGETAEAAMQEAVAALGQATGTLATRVAMATLAGTAGILEAIAPLREAAERVVAAVSETAEAAAAVLVRVMRQEAAPVRAAGPATKIAAVLPVPPA